MRSLPAAFMAEIEAHDESTGETVTMAELFRRRARLGSGGRVELPSGETSTVGSPAGGEMAVREEAARFLSKNASLDVSPDALPEHVRRAYRRAASYLHPDAGGDPEDFRKLQQARDILIGEST